MKKDFSKICIRTILTYFAIISMICCLKAFHIDCFGIKYDNSVLNYFSDFVTKNGLENIWYSITLYIYTYFILSISCSDNSKRMKIYSLIITLIGIPFKFFTNTISNEYLRYLFEFIFLLVPPIIYKKNIKILKQVFLFLIINTLFQVITGFCKNVDVKTYNKFITNIMFDIDYIIMQLLFYHYYFERKEVKDLWAMVVGKLCDK